MVYDMVHDLRKNTAEGQDFFVVHACTKSLHKAHEISCTKISNSSSPDISITNKGAVLFIALLSVCFLIWSRYTRKYCGNDLVLCMNLSSAKTNDLKIILSDYFDYHQLNCSLRDSQSFRICDLRIYRLLAVPCPDTF